MSTTKELFGGAITVTLPSHLIDASYVLFSFASPACVTLFSSRDLRQVPDTQEVFLSPTSGISIIVEVLQSVSATDLREAAGYADPVLVCFPAPQSNDDPPPWQPTL